jgi:hypothetical protein
MGDVSLQHGVGLESDCVPIVLLFEDPEQLTQATDATGALRASVRDAEGDRFEGASADHAEARRGKTGADLRGLQEEFHTGRGYPPPPDPRPDGRLSE